MRYKRMKPGETFAQGKYTLIRKLRASGMAEVWLARQHGTEGFAKDVVIKRILPHLAEDNKLVTMFLDEARIAANLNHPNVVQIFDLGNDGYNYFIAMEYIRGHDIEQIQDQIKQRRLQFPIELAVQMVSNTCLGLAYAHDCKTADGTPMQVVHRDVSPQNILVSEAGVVKLIDFGIAKARTSSTRTQVGHTKGKICYMSPEQMMARELDRRSDIFSLGIVMYEMLCGIKPFDGDNLLACYHKLKQGIPDPRTHRSELSPELAGLMMKALAYDREDRYPTATALRYELQRYLSTQGMAIGPEHLSDFLTWLFAPPDSTQFVFDFPKNKPAVATPPPQAPSTVVNDSPLPTVVSPLSSTQDYRQRYTPAPSSANHNHVNHTLSGRQEPQTIQSQPFMQSPVTGPEIVFDDATFADDSPISLGATPGLVSHNTGPELGVPLSLDSGMGRPYTSTRRRRNKKTNPILFLLPLLLLAGGAGAAYYIGLFETQSNASNKNSIAKAKPPALPDAGTPAVPERRAVPEPKPAVEKKRPRPRKRVLRRPKKRQRRIKRRRTVRRRYYRSIILHVNKKHSAIVTVNGGSYKRLPMIRPIRVRANRRHRFLFIWSKGRSRKSFRVRKGRGILEISCKIRGSRMSCQKKNI